MKFTTSALFVLASSAISTKAQTCLSAGEVFNISDDLGCDVSSFELSLDVYLTSISCAHDAKTELRHIFGSETNANQAIASICADGWSRVDSSAFSDVDPRFTNSFMNEYVAGGTFLNSKYILYFKMNVQMFGSHFAFRLLKLLFINFCNYHLSN